MRRPLFKNAFDFKTPIKQNITLYAKWTASAAADANKVEGAKTGDSSHAVIWAVLLGAAVVCLLSSCGSAGARTVFFFYTCFCPDEVFP